MPSFDVVSEVDMHEMTNAVDQAQREMSNRFDFKGVDAAFELNDSEIIIRADVDFQTRQMLEILQNKMSSRKLDLKALKIGEVEISGQRAILKAQIQQGIETDIARKIVKKVKDQKMKVQVAIQGDKLRVTGKKRDDLQEVMAVLRKDNWGLPLQFNNFRD
ncbi:MAG: YajQ family cyclic di-GMP-binding protein [Gammaproteobacteria bacterium]|nr:YajQ family cyclic di-GMP-binding protein [Gammaproteobacteria bacterium]|tara:strand:- start:703 stop:1185 length:483 start_codon:yes stop_codon:yes gene_type:complete